MKRVAMLGLTVIAGGSIAWTSARGPMPAVRHEIIAVYIGVGGTDDSTDMAGTIRSLNEQMTRESAARGERFISRGVSIEPTVQLGLAHLTRLGRFDEISAGGNWANSSALRYLQRHPDGTVNGMVPQLIILRRDFSLDGSTLDVSPEREIRRIVGVKEIQDWVRAGARLTR